VIEYDLYQQMKLFSSVGDSLKGSANRYFKQPLQDLKKWAKRHRKSAAGIVILFGVGILLLSLRRKRRQGPDARISRPQKRVRGPVALHYLATAKLLGKRGYRRADATTPREFAGRLVEAEVAGAEPFRKLTELYYRAEYSTAHFADASRAVDLRQQVTSALRESKTKKRRATAI
jgi:hypothetical protein